MKLKYIELIYIQYIISYFIVFYYFKNYNIVFYYYLLFIIDLKFELYYNYNEITKLNL